MLFRSILVVCVGNICRSPMAEALLTQRLGDRGIHVASAGIGAMVGYPADPLAAELLAARGLDLSAHRARQLEAEHIGKFDLILVMENWHKREIEVAFPQARGRVFRICHWRETDIPDPYRKPKDVFAEALASIEAGIDDWMKKLCID